MLDQILNDLQTLNESFDPELIENHTHNTRTAIMPLVNGDEFTEKQKQNFIKVFLADLSSIGKVAPKDNQNVLQNMVTEYSKMLNPAPQPTRPNQFSESLNLRRDISSNNAYRGSVVGSNYSKMTTASAARSTLFRNQASRVPTTVNLEEKLGRICKSDDNRKQIAVRLVSELKFYKNDIKQYKEVISHLENYLATILVRTDVNLNRINKTLINLDLGAAAHPRTRNLLDFINEHNHANEGDSFPQDRSNLKSIQELLTVIMTNISKENSVNACINNALNLVIPVDVVSSEKVSDSEEMKCGN